MGVVYRALDLSTNRELVLKRCLPGPHDALTRLMFQREYYTLASLCHPRIIEVYDYGVEGGQPFYTMELLDGRDLTEVAPLPWRRACSCLRDVASSLLLLHQRGLVHRDLSPRNVRFTSAGFCKLLDFGALTSFGVPTEVVGTPAVMAPELLRGLPVDQRADLFSLGALAYYLLTRTVPYEAQETRQLEQAWAVSPEPPSDRRARRGLLDDDEPLPAALDELLIAECLLGSDVLDTQLRLDAGFHLVHGGEDMRGAELLRSAALELVHRYDDMIAAAPALELALRIFREQRRRPEEQLELLMPLCFAGYYVDRKLSERHGDATIALAEETTGLALARRLRPWLGKHLSLALGLARGLLHFMLTPNLGGFSGFKQLLTSFSTCVVFLCAKSTICLEPETIERLARHLEPLTALGKRSAATVSHRFALAFLSLTRGHAARAAREFRQLLEILKAPERITDFPMEALVAMRGGALYALGAMEGFRDTPEALAVADELESLGHRIYDMAADQVRVNYYACRADLENAAVFRRQLDTHALSNGSAWQAEVWAPCSQILADLATDDVMSTKRTLNELERLSLDLPSARRYEVGARLAYLEQTNRSEEALREFPHFFAGSPPHGFIGWVTAHGSLACALNALGRHEEARKVCLDTLAWLEPDDLLYVALNFRVEEQLVRAEIGLGRYDAALRLLQTLVERHGDNEGPITMGHVHAAQAELALAMRDELAFERHAQALERVYQRTTNPRLVAQATRLRLRARAAGLMIDMAGQRSLVRSAHADDDHADDDLDGETVIETVH